MAYRNIARTRPFTSNAIHIRPTQFLRSRNSPGSTTHLLSTGPSSSTSPPPNTLPPPAEPDQQFHQWDYIKPTAHVFSTFRKLLVYSSAFTVSIAVITLLGFEATHQWVEHVAMKPPQKDSPGDEVWAWGGDQESWTGGESGGTDPALGVSARHLLRAAWMAQHWGIGGVSGPDSRSIPGQNGSRVSAYRTAEQFLAQVLAIAQENARIQFPSTPGSPLSGTVVDLLNLHARLLERIGTTEALASARDEYLVLWQGLSHNVSTHVEAARVASKIGDLSHRLQEGDAAVSWWNRAVDYATLGGKETASGASVPSSPPVSNLPQVLPPSPLAQRTLISALASLSAYYATTHQFANAQAVESGALRLLSASSTQHLTSTEMKAASTPEHAAGNLHTLFLQHRSSALSVHLAEVLYASQPPSSSTSSRWKPKQDVQNRSAASQIHLHLAATTSERVAHTLTNVTGPYDGARSAITHKLAPIYATSPVLAKPAANLLRDARRTAAEAWNLSGMLYEIDGRWDDLGKALECFERAVHWSGGQYAMANTASQVVETEWETYWKNYVRVKERLSR